MQLELLPTPKIRSPSNADRDPAQEALFQSALEAGRREVIELETTTLGGRLRVRTKPLPRFWSDD